jgi:hypothetical protein
MCAGRGVAPERKDDIATGNDASVTIPLLQTILIRT